MTWAKWAVFPVSQIDCKSCNFKPVQTVSACKPHCVCIGDDNYGRIVFLYQLEKAEAGGSYGINVAALAGLSEDILTLAQRKSYLAKKNSGIIHENFVNVFK